MMKMRYFVSRIISLLQNIQDDLMRCGIEMGYDGLLTSGVIQSVASDKISPHESANQLWFLVND